MLFLDGAPSTGHDLDGLGPAGMVRVVVVMVPSTAAAVGGGAVGDSRAPVVDNSIVNSKQGRK